MTAARRLRERLATGEPLLLPGAYNALTARLFELEGFEAVYTGGYSAAAANWALPDIGLVTQTELVDHVQRVAGAVAVPVISDADTGFGDLINVTRTVREYERAGAAGIQIEDQVFPKRCGHMEGKRVIPLDEMVAKVRAAVAARRDPDTVIVARTDAIAVTGLDDAIDRLNAYAAAGADVLFPDAPRSYDELRAIRAGVPGTLLVNISERGKTPPLDLRLAGELGYAIALFSSAALFAAAQSARELAKLLRTDGSTDGMLDRIIDFGELNELLGLSAWQAEEERLNTGP